MTLDKRTVALGLAAAAAVAAAVSVTVLGHGSSASPQRQAVSAYIDRVNAIQNAMGKPLARVLLAYRDFTGHGSSRVNSAAELAQASATLTRLQRRLVRLAAPPDARALRRLIVRLVGEQAALTAEVQKLAVFTPRFGAALARVQQANAALGRALAAIKPPASHSIRGTKKHVLAEQAKFRAEASAAAAAQATAIEVYTGVVNRTAAQIAALRPPTVLRPSFSAQLRSLHTIVSTGRRLAGELRQPNRSNVSALGRKFALASRIAQSKAAQKAQIAAIEHYNARARAIAQTAADVQGELARLRRDLP